MNLSLRLVKLAGRETVRQLEAEVRLASLAESFFRAEQIHTPAWFNSETLPTIKVAVLLNHLLEIARHDSCVQDVSTTGHLGKLLVRWDVWASTKNYELLGVPNSKLDSLSWRDRSELFAEGVSLNRLTAKESLESAGELLQRERGWTP